jgi:putative restriction endonuclease
MAGIWGTGRDGASSIVMSGGYEDDIDEGDVIVYTGHGGNDPNTRRQVANQDLTQGNLALAKSCDDGLPLRVTRGFRLDSPYAPENGYRYDGLYTVERYWSQVGRSGFKIWRYRLALEPGEPAPPRRDGAAAAAAGTLGPASRAETTVQRIVRNSAVAEQVKDMYDHCCQICGCRIQTRAGAYSEGSHIRPLGRPHDGDDVVGNVLCLCPNHHVQLDLGGLTIDPSSLVITGNGIPSGRTLTVLPGHVIDRAQLAYHASLFQ